MNYELIIPDSIWRDPAMRPLMSQDLPLPALATLYGKGQRLPLPSTNLADFLASRFSVPDLALASTTLAHDLPSAEAGFWLRADPVHLRIDRDRLTVLGVPFFQITQLEADALVAGLNQLFTADGFTFFAATPTRWYLRLPSNPGLKFTPLVQALAENMNDHLPTGEGALKFHAVMNEIQMVLYGHAVNDARDEVGLPMVNSVWLWGAGNFPALNQPIAPAVPIWGGHELLPLLQGSAWQLAPNSAADLPVKNATVLLDTLSFDAIYGNAYEWRTAWQDLEKNWFLPLLAQLKSGQLAQLTLTFPDAAESICIKKSDLYRFWRSARLPF